MEHRVIITKKELLEILPNLKILSVGFVKDEYTGEKRTRSDESEKIREKTYKTPVKGTTYRFSAECEYNDIKNVWLEYKWTENNQRFEIEFEDQVPNQFKNKPNLKGWEILKPN